VVAFDNAIDAFRGRIWLENEKPIVVDFNVTPFPKLFRVISTTSLKATGENIPRCRGIGH
jgi:hypothetical protein